MYFLQIMTTTAPATHTHTPAPTPTPTTAPANNGPTQKCRLFRYLFCYHFPEFVLFCCCCRRRHCCCCSFLIHLLWYFLCKFFSCYHTLIIMIIMTVIVIIVCVCVCATFRCVRWWEKQWHKQQQKKNAPFRPVNNRLKSVNFTKIFNIHTVDAIYSPIHFFMQPFTMYALGHCCSCIFVFLYLVNFILIWWNFQFLMYRHKRFYLVAAHTYWR